MMTYFKFALLIIQERGHMETLKLYSRLSKQPLSGRLTKNWCHLLDSGSLYVPSDWLLWAGLARSFVQGDIQQQLHSLVTTLYECVRVCACCVSVRIGLAGCSGSILGMPTAFGVL